MVVYCLVDVLTSHYSGSLSQVARCTLEIFVDGGWQPAAEVRCDDPSGGHSSSTRLEYAPDYLTSLDFKLHRDAHALSCRFPTTFELFSEPKWPAFLLDVIPSGAARRYWERELGLPNRESSDWEILRRGAGNPPGNVRIAEAAEAISVTEHEGFDRSDVITRAADFVEYARSAGAPVTGASGAAGDAPKFQLREDRKGRWHADGALPDDRTRALWIVKFPRSPRAADRLVLEAEAPFMRIAKRLGARVTTMPSWIDDCLFVPRFDRIVRGRKIERLGLESLCSLAGVTEFGAPIAKEALALALAKYASEPELELREFLLRDVLDVALGNTDNHARNTSVLKNENGRIALSPLYDFAPMVLDPQGIARVCRWKAEDDGFPRWSEVVDHLATHGLDPNATKNWLRELAPRVAGLTEAMREEGVPKRVVEILQKRTLRVARMLEEKK